MAEAWNHVKANKGAGGMDGISIQDIVAYGEERFLEEIETELKEGNYHPTAVKRVLIPKPDGRKRPLGLPTIWDKIIRMAAKIVIELLFEADFKENSYGFRPKKNARQALEVIRKACNTKGYYVIDADTEAYFDNINQANESGGTENFGLEGTEVDKAMAKSGSDGWFRAVFASFPIK